LAGSSYPDNPCLRLLAVNKTKLKPLANLASKKAKNTTIRSSAVTPEHNLVTGSEDGLICVWTKGDTIMEVDDADEGRKAKSEKKASKKGRNPY
jgi:hypothetical protein